MDRNLSLQTRHFAIYIYIRRGYLIHHSRLLPHKIPHRDVEFIVIRLKIPIIYRYDCIGTANDCVCHMLVASHNENTPLIFRMLQKNGILLYGLHGCFVAPHPSPTPHTIKHVCAMNSLLNVVNLNLFKRHGKNSHRKSNKSCKIFQIGLERLEQCTTPNNRSLANIEIYT